jgi:hypothetical protein
MPQTTNLEEYSLKAGIHIARAVFMQRAEKFLELSGEKHETN